MPTGRGWQFDRHPGGASAHWSGPNAIPWATPPARAAPPSGTLRPGSRNPPDPRSPWRCTAGASAGSWRRTRHRLPCSTAPPAKRLRPWCATSTVPPPQPPPYPPDSRSGTVRLTAPGQNNVPDAAGQAGAEMRALLVWCPCCRTALERVFAGDNPAPNLLPLPPEPCHAHRHPAANRDRPAADQRIAGPRLTAWLLTPPAMYLDYTKWRRNLPFPIWIRI